MLYDPKPNGSQTNQRNKSFVCFPSHSDFLFVLFFFLIHHFIIIIIIIINQKIRVLKFLTTS